MKVFSLLIVFFSSLFLFGCGNKNQYADLDKPPTEDTIKDLVANININNEQKPTSTTTPTSVPISTPLLINPNQTMQDPQALQTNAKTVVVISTTKGNIKIKLYDQETPKSVANFQSKVNSSFYNNLTFHRVEPGFVVQGGDPLGNGTGGGQIASEITQHPFARGSVGLARGGDIKITNDSQFFICLATETCSQLTGQYVNFGEVIEGMEIVDTIAVGDKINSISFAL